MSTISSTSHPISSVVSRSWVQRHPMVAYFAIAFAGTWALVIPLALSTGFNLFPLPEVAFIFLFIFSAYFGPLLGALVVTRATEGGAGVRRLLKRIVQWRVGIPWYLAAFFSMLLIWLAAYSILYSGAPLRELIANPLLLTTLFLPKIVEGIFIPSLGEEPGWRGFALPRLQEKHGPVLATLILGALHGLWHFPALFTSLFGPLPLEEILPFMLTAIGTTFLYTWVVNHARGSILIAILMHASSNAASSLLYEIVPLDKFLPGPVQGLTSGWFNVIIFGLAAVILVALTRGRLGYRPDSRSEPAQKHLN